MALASNAPATKRQIYLANIALLLANAIFGAGNVVGKIGLQGMNPILFALIREVISGPLLVAIASFVEPGVKLDPKDWWRFVLTGVGLFGTNFCYIVGVKLAGATTAGIWQPAQPLFITLIAIYLGYEKSSVMKFVGIIVAAGGCLFVSLYGAKSSFGDNQLAGNIIFFIQCICCAAFYVSEKPLLKRYPPITTVGYAYLVASCLMTVTAVTVNESKPILNFLCDDCNGEGWVVPSGSWLAIAYWVFAGSVAGYLLNTWGNQYVDASLLGIYTVVQPIITVLCSSVAIAESTPWKGSDDPHWGLRGLGVSDLGAIGIFLGLGIVVYDNNQQQRLAQGGIDDDKPAKDVNEQDRWSGEEGEIQQSHTAPLLE
jgi:drug/metabolite transporter (DMT)-like permease